MSDTLDNMINNTAVGNITPRNYYIYSYYTRIVFIRLDIISFTTLLLANGDSSSIILDGDNSIKANLIDHRINSSYI